MTENIRPRQTTVAEHLAGSKDSWHGQISTDGPFQPARDRYHLYIGLFCPFAHRANLVRVLKGLEDVLPLSVVRPYPKGDASGWPGWCFPVDDKEYSGATSDHLFGAKYLHELYFKADEKYQGRYSVPMLWDKRSSTIVNNESTELVRNLQTGFDSIIEDRQLRSLSFYPEHHRTQIDEICEWMQRDLNTGVYKAGFSSTQADYDRNVLPVFAALNKLEKLISHARGPFVLGAELTEVDLRLYPTVIRFDVVYVQHFKCNLGMIRSDYPQIHNWMKGLYWGKAQLPDGSSVWGFGKETTDFKHIKENYTKSHGDVNPLGITPRGPWPDVEAGFEPDFSKVKVGGVAMPEVVELEMRLPG